MSPDVRGRAGRRARDTVQPWPTAGGGERLGLFGGTFDPPHVGHLATAVNVRHDLGLDRVLLVVNNLPWQKVGSREISPAADRLAMVEAAVGDVEGLEASRLEIDAGGLSYTADTLATLLAEDPTRELFVDPGQRRGRRPADLGAGGRGAGAGHDRGGRPARARRLRRRCPAGAGSGSRSRASSVSSTELRARAADGRPLDFLVTRRGRGVHRGAGAVRSAATHEGLILTRPPPTRPASGRSPPPGPPTPSRPGTSWCSRWPRCWRCAAGS